MIDSDTYLNKLCDPHSSFLRVKTFRDIPITKQNENFHCCQSENTKKIVVLVKGTNLTLTGFYQISDDTG